MTQKKLSIIVPVYNVAPYLERCVNSLLEQDLSVSDYEVLLINDGSTDESGQLADKLANEHENISTFHKQNGGLSSARNYGVSKARGDYIWFVDSDDYIKSGCLGGLLSFASKNNIDYVFFSIFEVFDGRKILCNYSNQPMKVVNSYELLSKHTLYFSAWCFISKRRIWADNNIRFVEGIIHEDYDSSLRLLQYCKFCSYYNGEKGLYNYIINRQGSITSVKTKERYLHSIRSWEEIILNMSQVFDKDNAYSLLMRSYAAYFKCLLINALLNSSLGFKDKTNIINALYEKKLLPTGKPIRYPAPSVVWKNLFLLLKNRFFLKLLCFFTCSKRVRDFLMKIHVFIKKSR